MSPRRLRTAWPAVSRTDRYILLTVKATLPGWPPALLGEDEAWVSEAGFGPDREHGHGAGRGHARSSWTRPACRLASHWDPGGLSRSASRGGLRKGCARNWQSRERQNTAFGLGSGQVQERGVR